MMYPLLSLVACLVAQDEKIVATTDAIVVFGRDLKDAGAFVDGKEISSISSAHALVVPMNLEPGAHAFALVRHSHREESKIEVVAVAEAKVVDLKLRECEGATAIADVRPRDKENKEKDLIFYALAPGVTINGEVAARVRTDTTIEIAGPPDGVARMGVCDPKSYEVEMISLRIPPASGSFRPEPVDPELALAATAAIAPRLDFEARTGYLVPLGDTTLEPGPLLAFQAQLVFGGHWAVSMEIESQFIRDEYAVTETAPSTSNLTDPTMRTASYSGGEFGGPFVVGDKDPSSLSTENTTESDPTATAGTTDSGTTTIRTEEVSVTRLRWGMNLAYVLPLTDSLKTFGEFSCGYAFGSSTVAGAVDARVGVGLAWNLFGAFDLRGGVGIGHADAPYAVGWIGIGGGFSF